MSNVQFEEGYNQMNGQYYNTSTGDRGMAAWLIKKGFSKNKQIANAILAIIAILFLGITVFLIIDQDTVNLTDYPRETIPTEDPLPPSLLRPNN